VSKLFFFWQMAKTIIGGWLVDHMCKNCNK